MVNKYIFFLNLLLSFFKELNRKSNEIMANLKKINRADLPVKTLE